MSSFDLVPTSNEGTGQTGSGGWDMPPPYAPAPLAGIGRPEIKGDEPVARGEAKQGRWDWGDLQTWAILFGLFFLGIAIAGAAYLMPAGQHASTPPILVH